MPGMREDGTFRDERWKPKPWIPDLCFKNPVVILDSGQSVDESVYLQLFRKWLFTSIVARSANDAPRPHVHLYYPSDRLWARYGLPQAAVDKADGWEVGTLRLPGKDLYPWGMMHSFASYEDGCIFSKDSDRHSAPWRRRPIYGGHTNRHPENSGNRRGIPIYLNPTARDIEYLRRHENFWRVAWRCPKIMLGLVRPNKVPLGLMGLVNCWYSLNPVDTSHTRKGLENSYIAAEIPSKKLGGYLGITRSKAISIAPNWRSRGRQRKPFAASWVKDEFPDLQVKLPQRDATWQDFVDVTDCGIYIVLSEQETIPFDAYLAAARGAILVAPNTPLFQNIPMYLNKTGKRWLYTVRDYGHNRYGWSHTEVRQWLIPKIRQWQQSQTQVAQSTKRTI
jgi:hypothetical protein